MSGYFVLNFSKQFADAVERGEKRQTIRAERKDLRRPHKGQRLTLYTGMRTKSCRLLRVVTCTACLPVSINFRDSTIRVSGAPLRGSSLEDFAQMDGFESSAALFDWFRKAHAPKGSRVTLFVGWCCRWEIDR